MINGVVGFGESVIDFIPVGTDDGCTVYKACPGGSVANLCVVVARQGVPAAFVGGVGCDAFGDFLQERIAAYGVDTSAMIRTPDCGTNLTFVQLLENGGRAYSAVNLPGADKMVDFEKIDLGKILSYRVLHVSSNAMVCGKTNRAQPRLLKEAKAHGMIVSYDVNYRANYYSSREEELRVLTAPLPYADIVKVTDEELAYLTGGSSEAHARQLLSGATRLVLVTRGAEGCDYVCSGGAGHVDACSVSAVDTTGAGDNFLGGFLSWMLLHGDIDRLRESDIAEACSYGNRTAALSVLKIGAMSSVPTREETEAFI